MGLFTADFFRSFLAGFGIAAAVMAVHIVPQLS